MTTKRPVPLEQALAQARAIAPALANATDTLNKRIVEAEDALKDLGLGVSTSITLFADEDGAGDDLCFMKWDKTWRLMVVDNDNETWEPLINASREARLRAVQLLPLLVEKLISDAQDELKKVEEATQLATHLTEKLKAGGL